MRAAVAGAAEERQRGGGRVASLILVNIHTIPICVMVYAVVNIDWKEFGKYSRRGRPIDVGIWRKVKEILKSGEARWADVQVALRDVGPKKFRPSPIHFRL
tara:strand:- start:908 stop:1210 length:303 start_codon:yes stop_codon:yes gene_type:complete